MHETDIKISYLRAYAKCYLVDMAHYSDIFYLGYLYNILQDDMAGRNLGSESKAWSAIWILNTFREYLVRTGINDKGLDMFIEEAKETFNKYDKGVTLVKATDAAEIKTKLSGMWNHVVNDLLKQKKLILEIDDMTLNPKKLREGVEGFFTQNEVSKIPQNIQLDLKDSMTNILLGLWTPCVMINLRAVEGILRRFYKKKTGKNAVPRTGKFLNWGKILKELRGKKIKRELMIDLSFLNGRRNDAQHPDRRFTQDEAENIFNRSLYALRGMLAEL
ncbi:MAG: hypothetical protein M1160_02075 [Candidatus Marsarchaeota archaeon]|jgi:hypothetical protein|nr:hypothetical protein [Candidatus Marsarchaeota archaeon]MCL5111649.1 hypothetical protein [Candidatus Marsarchaeota archaeon]